MKNEKTKQEQVKKLFVREVPVYLLEFSEYADNKGTIHYTEQLYTYDRDNNKYADEPIKEVIDPQEQEKIQIPKISNLWEFDIPEAVLNKLNEWKEQGIIKDYNDRDPYINELDSADLQTTTYEHGDCVVITTNVAVQITTDKEHLEQVKEWLKIQNFEEWNN